MNRRVIGLVSVAVIVIGVIIAVAWSSHVVTPVSSSAPIKANLKVGDAAPPFQLSSTAGYFDSTQIHKPIVLEVFATWCPHCRRETATLNKLYAQYGTQMAFIAVNGSDRGADEVAPESQAGIVEFAKYFKVQYPIAFDPDLNVAKNYLLGGFPTIVVIDSRGRIASIHSGEESEEALRKRLKLAV